MKLWADLGEAEDLLAIFKEVAGSKPLVLNSPTAAGDASVVRRDRAASGLLPWDQCWW
jgi:hypothetical protein